MPRKKTRASGTDRATARSLYSQIVAREVMPPCSRCVRSQLACKLRAGQGACVKCELDGKSCDLFLTREDGECLPLIVVSF